MERLNSGPLADQLHDRRERFNTLYAMAQQQNRRLDRDAFGAHVCRELDAIVRAVAAVTPQAVPQAAAELYALSLELFAKSVLGSDSRYPAVARMWHALFPTIATWVAQAPRHVCARLTNAVCHLTDEASTDVADAWQEHLRELAPLCLTQAEFLAAGQVLAWTHGMASYRESAIRQWETLSPPVQRAVFGVAASRTDVRPEMLRARLDNPWRHPASAESLVKPTCVARVGGFRGLDGIFLQPPHVGIVAGQIMAWDDKQVYALHADCFGSKLTRVHPEQMPRPGSSAAADMEVSFKGKIRWHGAWHPLPEAAGCREWSAAASTLALVVPHSYYIFIVALA